MSVSDSISKSSIKTVDVMTSVKGGVGKTLFSLALSYCHLAFRSERILAIDANTTNVDLWSFLHNLSHHPLTLSFASENWQQSPIYEERHSTVLKKERHARLFNGCGDFWDQMIGMIVSERYATAAVIDTNLMVGNLSYVSGCIEAMKQLTDAGIKVRLWFIWTFSALRDKHFIQRDILDLEHESSGIQIMHVLNPSALIPEKINPEPSRIEQAKQTRAARLQEMIQEVEQYAMDIGDDPELYTEDLENLRENTNKKYDLRKANEPVFTSHVHVPLQRLRDSAPSNLLAFNEFHEQMEPLLSLLEEVDLPLQGPEALDPILEKWLLTSFKSGCPVNVAPCPYFNVSLKGYTDYVTKRPNTLELLGKFLGKEVIDTVAFALQHIETED
jgi:hypothetical protein